MVAFAAAAASTFARRKRCSRTTAARIAESLAAWRAAVAATCSTRFSVAVACRSKTSFASAMCRLRMARSTSGGGVVVPGGTGAVVPGGGAVVGAVDGAVDGVVVEADGAVVEVVVVLTVEFVDDEFDSDGGWAVTAGVIGGSGFVVVGVGVVVVVVLVVVVVVVVVVDGSGGGETTTDSDSVGQSSADGA